jgi:hypothetical protein
MYKIIYLPTAEDVGFGHNGWSDNKPAIRPGKFKNKIDALTTITARDCYADCKGVLFYPTREQLRQTSLIIRKISKHLLEVIEV